MCIINYHYIQNFMIQKISIIQYYLLLSLPLMLTTGPFLPDLVMSLIGILFLLNFYLKKNFNLFKLDIFGKIFFLWCVYLIVLSILSTNPYLSLEASLFFFRFGIFAYAVRDIIDSNQKLKVFLFILFSSVVLVLINAYFQYFLGADLFNNEYDNYRITLLGDEKFTGHYIVRMIPIIFAAILLIYYKSPFLIFVLMVIFILSDVIIFLSGERTSFFMISLFTLMILFLISKWKLLRILTIFISVLLIYFILNNDSHLKHRMVLQTLNQTESSVTFSPEHDLLYESAINMFIDNKLFGFGPKIFRIKCSDEKYGKDSFGYKDKILAWEDNKSCNTHPHNIYLQLLAETGLIGTLPVIVLYFYISYLLFKHLVNIIFLRRYLFSDYLVCLLISVFIQLWPVMPHLSFFSNRTNVFLFLTFGLIMAYQKKNEKKND